MGSLTKKIDFLRGLTFLIHLYPREEAARGAYLSRVDGPSDDQTVDEGATGCASGSSTSRDASPRCDDAVPITGNRKPADAILS